MKETEERDDSLWQLLGKARRTAPSALFTANVLREVRLLESEPRRATSIFDIWLRSWALPAAAAVVLAVCTIVGSEVFSDSRISPVASSSGSQFADDILAIASLDILFMEEDTALWSDIGSL